MKAISNSTLITAKSREGRRPDGDGNTITSKSNYYGFVASGQCNTIGTTSSASYRITYGFIGNGLCNCIAGSSTGSCYNSIGNGQCNIICAGACYSSITTGCCNIVNGVGANIVGGLCNTVSGYGAFIGNGAYNLAAGIGATVVNGSCNQALGNLSFIGGGGVNLGAAPVGNFINSLSEVGVITGGSQNYIGDTGSAYASTFGFIGGGLANCIDSTGTASSYGVIGGGRGNVICAGTKYSSILNGADNTNSGVYSAILGGSGNVIPAGCNYVATFGNGVTACINNALHLENLWLKPSSYCSYAGFPAPFAPGTVYIDTTVGAGKPLRIV